MAFGRGSTPGPPALGQKGGKVCPEALPSARAARAQRWGGRSPRTYIDASSQKGRNGISFRARFLLMKRLIH